MSELDRIDSPDNPAQWELEAAFEQAYSQMTVEEQMEHYFPGVTAAEVADANPFDLLMKVALKRREEGKDEEDDEASWEIMEAVWNRAREMVKEEEALDEQLEP